MAGFSGSCSRRMSGEALDVSEVRYALAGHEAAVYVRAKTSDPEAPSAPGGIGAAVRGVGGAVRGDVRNLRPGIHRAEAGSGS